MSQVEIFWCFKMLLSRMEKYKIGKTWPHGLWQRPFFQSDYEKRQNKPTNKQAQISKICITKNITYSLKSDFG